MFKKHIDTYTSKVYNINVVKKREGIEEMNYFEVLYKTCTGKRRAALVATPHATPEIPTTDFNFGWNGNHLIEYHATDRCHYSSNTYQFYIAE
jgi:hypothetical protein